MNIIKVKCQSCLKYNSSLEEWTRWLKDTGQRWALCPVCKDEFSIREFDGTFDKWETERKLRNG